MRAAMQMLGIIWIALVFLIAFVFAKLVLSSHESRQHQIDSVQAALRSTAP